MAQLGQIFKEGANPDLGLLLIVAAGLAPSGDGIRLSKKDIESLDLTKSDLCIELTKEGDVNIWLADVVDDAKMEELVTSGSQMHNCQRTDCMGCGNTATCFDSGDVIESEVAEVAEVEGGN